MQELELGDVVGTPIVDIFRRVKVAALQQLNKVGIIGLALYRLRETFQSSAHSRNHRSLAKIWLSNSWGTGGPQPVNR